MPEPAARDALQVRTSRGSYPVVVSDGALAEIAGVAGRPGRALLVHPAAASRHATTAASSLTAAGWACTSLLLPDGESAKTLTQAERVWSALADLGATPADLLVAVGGGAATDLGGFAAATWRRGMPWLAAPTTLSSMVDAAVGGKTAVNTTAGKNTAGVLHDPVAVVADLATLSTLPPAVLADGLAEVVKVALTHVPELLDDLERFDMASPDPADLERIVRAAVAVSVDVACGRFGPGGCADVLSVGHEVAHALEALSSMTVSHGRAVAVGLAFTTTLSADAGWCPPELPARLRSLLHRLQLPAAAGDLDAVYPWPAVREALRHDKRMAGQLRFLAPGPGGTGWLGPLAERDVAAAWARQGD